MAGVHTMMEGAEGEATTTDVIVEEITGIGTEITDGEGTVEKI